MNPKARFDDRLLTNHQIHRTSESILSHNVKCDGGSFSAYSNPDVYNEKYNIRVIGQSEQEFDVEVSFSEISFHTWYNCSYTEWRKVYSTGFLFESLQCPAGRSWASSALY